MLIELHDTKKNTIIFLYFRYLQDTKNLALLLDYDGTLTPIVAHPDLAVIPPETKALLEDLSNVPNIFLAIISGRNPDNVKQMVMIQSKCSITIMDIQVL